MYFVVTERVWLYLKNLLAWSNFNSPDNLRSKLYHLFSSLSNDTIDYLTGWSWILEALARSVRTLEKWYSLVPVWASFPSHCLITDIFNEKLGNPGLDSIVIRGIRLWTLLTLGKFSAISSKKQKNTWKLWNRGF
jgi:hypothetical protein